MYVHEAFVVLLLVLVHLGCKTPQYPSYPFTVEIINSYKWTGTENVPVLFLLGLKKHFSHKIILYSVNIYIA